MLNVRRVQSDTDRSAALFSRGKVMGVIEGLLRGLWEKIEKKRDIFGLAGTVTADC